MYTQTVKHTITATGAGVQDRFVSYAGVQAAANDDVLGVAVTDFAAGQLLALHVLGICSVESGGAVAAGARIAPDAQGRAVTAAADATNAVGRALNAVTAAGQTLFILIK